jgi:hypothetical protein
MEIISGIYIITSPSNKIYIGLSANIHKRWMHYRFLSNTRNQPYLHNSFKKYGVSNHKFEVLEKVSEEDLSEREIYWINEKNSTDASIGMNIASGGNIPPKQNKPKSEEHKKKIGDANRGRIHSESTKEKIRQKRKLQVFTPEQIEKRSSKLRGVPSKLKGTKRPNISKKLKGRLTPISIKCKLINIIDSTEIEAGSIQELSRLSGVSVTSLLNIRKGNPPNKYKHFKYEQY